MGLHPVVALERLWTAQEMEKQKERCEKMRGPVMSDTGEVGAGGQQHPKRIVRKGDRLSPSKRRSWYLCGFEKRV